MKNITMNTNETRTISGGGVTVGAVLGAMGLIYGTVEACKWAWDTGAWLGNKIGSALFK